MLWFLCWDTRKSIFLVGGNQPSEERHADIMAKRCRHQIRLIVQKLCSESCMFVWMIQLIIKLRLRRLMSVTFRHCWADLQCGLAHKMAGTQFTYLGLHADELNQFLVSEMLPFDFAVNVKHLITLCEICLHGRYGSLSLFLMLWASMYFDLAFIAYYQCQLDGHVR